MAPSIIMVAAQSKKMNGRRKLNPPFCRPILNNHSALTRYMALLPSAE
jgi:hypothetical protein